MDAARKLEERLEKAQDEVAKLAEETGIKIDSGTSMV